MVHIGSIRRTGLDYSWLKAAEEAGIRDVWGGLAGEASRSLRQDAERIIEGTIYDVLPMKAVREVLKENPLVGPVCVIAIGKAAWSMADEARQILGDSIKKGIVVTKYGHSRGPITGFEILESGHPFPDDCSMVAAARVIELAKGVSAETKVLLLLSGGGSALVEMPAEGLTLDEVRSITTILLNCGANIVEINTVRKHLSAIKGGKLASYLEPASGYAIILSDVVGDHPEMIASGMTYPDETDAAEVMEVLRKHHLDFGEKVTAVLKQAQPTITRNIKNIIKGNVEELCRAAADHAERNGYKPYLVAADVQCEAWQLAEWFVNVARDILLENPEGFVRPCAIIVGGETVVKVSGQGLGGRNQEIALHAAKGIEGMERVMLFSLASDGTDGPTDAAGGIVDGLTVRCLERKGIDIDEYLKNNDSYHALKAVDSLIMTGPTGTNVNDVTVLLIGAKN